MVGTSTQSVPEMASELVSSSKPTNGFWVPIDPPFSDMFSS